MLYLILRVYTTFLHDLAPEYSFVPVHSEAEKATGPGGGRVTGSGLRGAGRVCILGVSFCPMSDNKWLTRLSSCSVHLQPRSSLTSQCGWHYSQNPRGRRVKINRLAPVQYTICFSFSSSARYSDSLWCVTHIPQQVNILLAFLRFHLKEASTLFQCLLRELRWKK